MDIGQAKLSCDSGSMVCLYENSIDSTWNSLYGAHWLCECWCTHFKALSV